MKISDAMVLVVSFENFRRSTASDELRSHSHIYDYIDRIGKAFESVFCTLERPLTSENDGIVSGNRGSDSHPIDERRRILAAIRPEAGGPHD